MAALKLDDVLKQFNLETLVELENGVAFAQIMRLFEQCVADIISRPGETRDRKVSVDFVMKGKTRLIEEVRGEKLVKTLVTEGVSMKIVSDNSIPNRQTTEYDMGIAPGNKLVFNPHFSDNHRQLPLLNEDDGEPAATVMFGG